MQINQQSSYMMGTLIINPFLVQFWKMVKHTLNIMRCSHDMLFKKHERLTTNNARYLKHERLCMKGLKGCLDDSHIPNSSIK